MPLKESNQATLAKVIAVFGHPGRPPKDASVVNTEQVSVALTEMLV